MATLLNVTRFSVFALVLILNTILCPVAVLNRSQIGTETPMGNYDAYLVALSGLTVIMTLVMPALAIFRRDAVPTRTVFETVWVGVLWILHLSSAATASAVMSSVPCGPTDLDTINGACTATLTILALTWLTTALLLLYLFVLVITAIVRSSSDPFVWSRDVCDLDQKRGQMYRTHGGTPSTATFGLKILTNGLPSPATFGVSSRANDKGRSPDSTATQLQVVVSRDVRTVNDHGESRRTSHIMSLASPDRGRDPDFSNWTFPTGVDASNTATRYPASSMGDANAGADRTAPANAPLSLYPKHIQPLMERHNQFAV